MRVFKLKVELIMIQHGFIFINDFLSGATKLADELALIDPLLTKDDNVCSVTIELIIQENFSSNSY